MAIPDFFPSMACGRYGPFIVSFKKEAERVVAELFDMTLALQKTLPVEFPAPIDSPGKYLRSLGENNLFPVIQYHQVSFSFPNSPLAKVMIKILKLEIRKIQPDYEKDLICPITMELFVDPVATPCGHTIERSEILRHFQTKKDCPICRKEIKDDKVLNPVLLIKNLAAEKRKSYLGFVIPTPRAVEDGHIDKQPTKAALLLEKAQSYIDENLYDEVLDQYKKVLEFTNESVDYAPLALYLERQKKDKPLESAYALFCLAILQLKENKSEYKETLDKAMALVPQNLVPEVCKAQYLQLNQKPNEAAAILNTLAELALSNQKTKEAIEHFEKSLEVMPDQIVLYEQLEELYERNKKIGLYLSAITYFGSQNPVLAQEFFNKSVSVAPDEPLVYLTYLTTLKKGDPKRVDPFRSLADLYKNKNNTAGYHYYLSKLIACRATEDYQPYVRVLLEAGKNEQAKKAYKKRTDGVQSEQKWEEAFQLIQEMITETGMEISLLEQQYALSQALTPKQERRAAFHLASYFLQDNPTRAETIYTTTQEKFHDSRSAELLGDLFAKTEKEKSLKFYCLATKNAFIQKKFLKITPLVQKALELDPNLSLLSEKEKSKMDAYRSVGLVNEELRAVKTRLQVLKNSISKEGLESGLEAITSLYNTQDYGKTVISIVADPYKQIELYLKPSLIDEIIDSGNIKSMIKDSRHPIARLKYKDYDFHFKEKPAHPLMHYAVHHLLALIAKRNLSPDMLFVRFNVNHQGEKKSYPVLISETLIGNDLKSSSPQDIDLASLTWTLLGSILTRPGDGVYSKYMVDNQKNLYCINHEASFVEPTVRYSFLYTSPIYFCAAPFSILPLDTELDRKVLEKFCQLDPYSILESWIKDVIQKEKEYTMLFSAEERKVLFEEDSKNSFTSTILLQEGILTTLHLQFISLIKAISGFLDKGKQPTAGDLLKELISLKTPSIGNYIYDAYNNGLLSPEDRLKKATLREQELSRTSVQYYEGALGKIPSLKEIEDEKLYSPQKGLDELNAAIFLEGEVFRFDFRHLKNDQNRQKLVLQAKNEEHGKLTKKPKTYIFHHHNLLTTDLLNPFLHSGLENLEFQNCEMIDWNTLLLIQEHCRNLKKLILIRCPKITEMKKKSSYLDFSKLSHCEISECDYLSSVMLESPSLEIFYAKNNPLLKEIHLKSKKSVMTDLTGSNNPKAIQAYM